MRPGGHWPGHDRGAAAEASTHGEAVHRAERAAVEPPIGVEVVDHRAEPAGRHQRIVAPTRMTLP